MKDGDVDYSGYTLRELEEALGGIYKFKFPRNYENLRAAYTTLAWTLPVAKRQATDEKVEEPPDPRPNYDNAEPYGMPLTKFLLSFEGRISRKSYWLFSFACAALVFAPIFFVFGFRSKASDDYVNLACLALLWPNLAVQAKRWHDCDKSAWWILINFAPIIGTLWSLIENGFAPGTQGTNRFGAHPRSANKVA